MKRPVSRSDRRAAIVGLGAALAVAALVILDPGFVRHARDAAIDAVSQLVAPAPSEGVRVIDIDGEGAVVQADGTWSRAQLAALVSAIARAGPAAIALDLVLAGNCAVDDAGNRALAEALGEAPTTLGFVLTDTQDLPQPASSIAVRQPVDIGGLWRSPGATLSCPQFTAAVASTATIALAGDESATVRSVPALVLVGDTLFPGLAVDVFRLASRAGTMIVGGVGPTRLSLGPNQIPVDRQAELRLHASGPADWPRRTLSADAVLSGKTAGLAGKIVIIGSSLPQMGGLRPTAANPLTPSIQIQADIATGLQRGDLPLRPSYALGLEAGAALACGLLVALAAVRLRPMLAVAVGLAAIGLWPAAAAAAFHAVHLAVDPLFPALGGMASGLAAGISQYAAARRAEARIRRSFEQRLPPTVVARLVRDGAGERLKGEERLITALVTDIEGFTAMTARTGPRELIRLLDGYFDGVTDIILDAGGMVDKIVGDAVHALFNAPLDLEGHETRALESAERILAFTEEYRRRPDVSRHGFGRTRIGIESGPAIVGDVGSFGKIDYTAYGTTVNLAARLQDANKVTGTSILVGAGVRSSAPPGWTFDSRGTLDLRGLGPYEIFAPVRSGDGPPA